MITVVIYLPWSIIIILQWAVASNSTEVHVGKYSHLSRNLAAYWGLIFCLFFIACNACTTTHRSGHRVHRDLPNTKRRNVVLFLSVVKKFLKLVHFRIVVYKWKNKFKHRKFYKSKSRFCKIGQTVDLTIELRIVFEM